MAQIGRDLAGHRPDGLVLVAFVLIITGLLVKGSIVPFQFWLADAHAVAPTPVCVLFSGVMVELGLYGVARVYWSMFGDGLGHRQAVGHVFLALGMLTAVVGALYCFRERHLKRLLAFSTISHAGMFMTGFALLTPLGLAGSALYVCGHALVKAALFLCVGIVIHRLGSVNESAMHGRGRSLKVTGVLFTLAALGLADLPPFATFLGKGWIEDSASSHGMSWIIIVLVICSILAGGAVLRVAGGVFYGLGDPPGEDPQMAEQASEETSETDAAKQRTPLTMIVPTALLVAGALALVFIPHLGSSFEAAVIRFQDQAGYARTVLHGAHVRAPSALFPAEPTGVTAADVLTGLVSTAGALVLAWLALYWRRLPVLRRGLEPGRGLAGPIQAVQSGVVNDYVTWLVVGVACIGGVLAVAIR
jgi:multicomponent Na+:H+ antiporter subunit D